MGHIRLGVLPKNPTWKSLINELGNLEIDIDNLSDAVLLGAKKILKTNSTKACISYSVWLLAQLVLASKGKDFTGDLSKLGVNIQNETSALEFISNIAKLSNQSLSSITPTTAINNIVNISLREALTQTIAIQSNSLFGSSVEDIQIALRNYSTNKQFSNLLHKFFSVFLRRTIRLVVDKEIANHIGAKKSFPDIQATNYFDSQLSLFSNQTVKIIDTFAGGWYSKKVWQDGIISSEEANKFVYIAMNKLSSDLTISGGLN